MTPTPENIRGILDNANSTFVSITFTKANGETRQLTTNPKHIGRSLERASQAKILQCSELWTPS